MKRLIKLVLCFVMLVSVVSFGSSKAEAEPAVTNIQINGDTLSWDPVEGATTYEVVMFGIQSVEFPETADTSINIPENLGYKGAKTGNYQVWRIDVRDEDGVLIATGGDNSLTYSYTAKGTLSGVPANLRWEGTTAYWDPSSDADSYVVKIYRGGVLWHEERTVTPATMYNAEKYVLGENFSFTFTVAGRRIGYVDGPESDHSSAIRGQKQIFKRLSGPSRYDTSIAVAEEFKSVLDEKMGIGAKEKLDAIFVATGTKYPDALSGSFFANSLNAPLLMINEKNAPKITDYIRNHLAPDGTVFVLGGTGVVPDEWLTGLNIRRMSGPNRYETNLSILRTYEDVIGFQPSTFVVCTGEAFADALSCSALDIPMLLVNSKKGLTDNQKAYLSSLDIKPWIYIIGGEGAVSAEIEADLSNYGEVQDRVAGKDRYKTSVKIARYFFGPARNEAVLATGKDYPDGLCAGPLANLLYAPVLLVADGKTEAVSNYFGKEQVVVKRGYIAGGTGAVSSAVAAAAFNEVSVE